MKTGKIHKSILIYLYIFLLFSFQKSHSEDMESVKISADDQLYLNITIYNNNIGLVKDTRNALIKKGLHHLYFLGIADRTIPSSVQIKSISAPDNFTVYEQNFEYDLLNRDTLLNKFIDKKVTLFFKSDLNGTEEEKEAILLKGEPDPIFQIGDKIYLGYPGRIILPEIPDNLVTKPTLLWLVDNREQKQQELELSYLTEEISWICNYVINLSKDESTMDLKAWVTINNNCGISFNNASVKLVAGDVKRADTEIGAGKRAYMMETALAAPNRAEIQEKTLSDYHIYTINRKTDLNNNQSKQISLFEADGIQVEKKYIISGQRYYFSSSYSDVIQNIPVEVTLEFVNSNKNKLGNPLPAGTVRIYKADLDNSLQFVGENKIGHIPSNENVEISFGTAFDIKCERKQTHFRKIRSDLYETGWEIKIKNQKDTDITVNVKENIPGDWKIIDSTHKYEKISSSVINFRIPVKKESESILRYSTEIKY